MLGMSLVLDLGMVVCVSVMVVCVVISDDEGGVGCVNGCHSQTRPRRTMPPEQASDE